MGRCERLADARWDAGAFGQPIAAPTAESSGDLESDNVSGDGRVDLRLTDTGDIYVIEVNANCYLEKDSEFAVSAKAQGIEFPELIQRIVDLAMERYAIKDPKPEALTEDAEAPAAVHS